ncbi:cellobiose phosphotransferase ydjC-like family protein [Candidatus Termititenax dinenymphae]|uniref:Cellobiose phosphotransferase ydjC-like family protein n=1 Tax=Candidatus Termititenax dinenymphae TaxID=2218523 RepID=A0A388TJQ1_9BACT|nr:cellobiose phosphotransferase ydjC-like family protein [Candidatus Termititenax dinenymphae]
MNIIINADDFGISESANQAISQLYKKGVISSATLMVDMPYAKDAAELAKKQNIPVGLHFNLTIGGSAKYKGRADFERQLLQGRIRIRFIKEELERQYQKMLDLGLTPTHLDTHQHIHNWPQIFSVFARFARQHQIPLRLTLEKTVFNKYDKFKISDLQHLLRKTISLVFGGLNFISAKALRVKTNNALTSVFALWPRPEKLTHKHLQLLLQKVSNNTEYMCHPVVSTENTPTSITETSVQEYDLMTNQEFFVMIANKFNLINFGEIDG